MEFTHRPTKINAVQWTGDLDTVLAFIEDEPNVEAVDDAAGVLWVTTRGSRIDVFPVPMGQWFVCWSNGRYACTPDASLREFYQPTLDLVSDGRVPRETGRC